MYLMMMMNNILTITFHSSFWEEMTINKFLGIMLIIFLYLVFLIIAAFIISYIADKKIEKEKKEIDDYYNNIDPNFRIK